MSAVTLEKLPREVILEVFLALPPRGAARLSQASKLLRAVGESRALWAAYLRALWKAKALDPNADLRAEFIHRAGLFAAVASARLSTTSHWVAQDPEDPWLVRYTGQEADAFQDNTVGVVTAQEPLPCLPFGLPALPSRDRQLQCKYFEVQVVNGGTNAFIGVGWVDRSSVRPRQPGWDYRTFGWHGDDGHAYTSSGWGVPFGPTFNAPDTVGSCLVYRPGGPGRIFYTHNGSLVREGKCFDNVTEPESLLPAVGLHSRGEAVRIRFGADGAAEDMGAWHAASLPAFAFDIGAHVAELHAQLDDAEERQASARNDESGSEAPAMEMDEAFSDLLRKVADVSDETEDTRRELCQFVAANSGQLSLEVIHGLDVHELRQVCTMLLYGNLVDIVDSGDETEEEDADESDHESGSPAASGSHGHSEPMDGGNEA